MSLTHEQSYFFSTLFLIVLFFFIYIKSRGPLPLKLSECPDFEPIYSPGPNEVRARATVPYFEERLKVHYGWIVWPLIKCFVNIRVRGIPQGSKPLSRSDKRELLARLSGPWNIKSLQDHHISRLADDRRYTNVYVDNGVMILSGGTHTTHSSFYYDDAKIVKVANKSVEQRIVPYKAPDGSIYLDPFGTQLKREAHHRGEVELHSATNYRTLWQRSREWACRQNHAYRNSSDDDDEEEAYYTKQKRTRSRSRDSSHEDNDGKKRSSGKQKKRSNKKKQVQAIDYSDSEFKNSEKRSSKKSKKKKNASAPPVIHDYSSYDDSLPVPFATAEPAPDDGDRDLAKQMKQLKGLYNEGTLTKEEYKDAKRKLLDKWVGVESA